MMCITVKVTTLLCFVSGCGAEIRTCSITYLLLSFSIRLTYMCFLKLTLWMILAQIILKQNTVHPYYKYIIPSTDRSCTTKPNILDWQLYSHKAQHIRLTATWPQTQHIKRKYKCTHLKDRRLSCLYLLERWSEQACSTLFATGKVISYTGS